MPEPIPTKIVPGSRSTTDVTEIQNIMLISECAILAACDAYGLTRDCILYSRVYKCSKARFAVCYLLRTHGMIWKYIGKIFNRDRATLIESKKKHLQHMRESEKELEQFFDMYWKFHTNLKKGNVNTK